MAIIDVHTKNKYSPEIYFKAVEMFVSEHANFLFGREEQQTTGEDLKKRYHKAYSGARMLGFVKLSECIVECKNFPSDLKCIEDLEDCFNRTLQLIQKLSDRELGKKGT